MAVAAIAAPKTNDPLHVTSGNLMYFAVSTKLRQISAYGKPSYNVSFRNESMSSIEENAPPLGEGARVIGTSP
jgi:hypothetical protein